MQIKLQRGEGGMVCLRCGCCCIMYPVVIVAPKVAAQGRIHTWECKGNFMLKESSEICPHLTFNDAQATCLVHDRSWYRKTPCNSYGQIEENENANCRLGQHIREKYGTVQVLLRGE